MNAHQVDSHGAGQSEANAVQGTIVSDQKLKVRVTSNGGPTTTTVEVHQPNSKLLDYSNAASTSERFLLRFRLFGWRYELRAFR